MEIPAGMLITNESWSSGIGTDDSYRHSSIFGYPLLVSTIEPCVKNIHCSSASGLVVDRYSEDQLLAGSHSFLIDDTHCLHITMVNNSQEPAWWCLTILLTLKACPKFSKCGTLPRAPDLQSFLFFLQLQPCTWRAHPHSLTVFLPKAFTCWLHLCPPSLVPRPYNLDTRLVSFSSHASLDKQANLQQHLLIFALHDS